MNEVLSEFMRGILAHIDGNLEDLFPFEGMGKGEHLYEPLKKAISLRIEVGAK